MSVANEYGTVEETETIEKESWGDFTGRTGRTTGNNWYTETFDSVREELSEAGDYLMFENIELPKEQILEKYDELEPGEDEYLEAELTSYPTSEGRFNVLELEKGEIEGITVASTHSSFKPTIQTDEFPSSEYERLVDVSQNKSESYTIMWEE